MLQLPGNQPDGSATFVPGTTSRGGVQLQLDADQTIATGSGTTEALVWSATALWDPDTIWTGGASATFTVPAGWTHARVIANVRWSLNTSGSRECVIEKNGAHVSMFGGDTQSNPDSSSPARMNIRSGIFDVEENDTIELVVSQTSGSNMTVTKGFSTHLTILRWDQPSYSMLDTFTSVVVPANTVHYVDGDTSRHKSQPNTLGFRDYDRSTSKLFIPPGGGIYRFYGGCRMDPVDEYLQLTFNTGQGDDQQYGEAYPRVQMRHNVGAYQSLANIASGPVKFPPDDVGDLPYGDNIQVRVAHGDASTTNLIDAFLQVERADDAFFAVLESSANQTVSNITLTTINYDTLKYEIHPGEFTTGVSTGAIVVPAVPGGGTWDYAIITATKTGTTQTWDRWMTMRVDTGGGFTQWIGCGDIVMQANEDGDPVIHIVGFYPLPVAGDEFHCTWWQNTGSNETIRGAGAGDTNTYKSDHFSVELFRQ